MRSIERTEYLKDLIESYHKHLQNIDNIRYFEPLIKEELIKCKRELRAIMDSDAEAMGMVKKNAHPSDFMS